MHRNISYEAREDFPEMIQIVMSSFFISCGFFIFPFLSLADEVSLRSDLHCVSRLELKALYKVYVYLASVLFNKPLLVSFFHVHLAKFSD